MYINTPALNLKKKKKKAFGAFHTPWVTLLLCENRTYIEFYSSQMQILSYINDKLWKILNMTSFCGYLQQTCIHHTAIRFMTTFKLSYRGAQPPNTASILGCYYHCNRVLLSHPKKNGVVWSKQRVSGNAINCLWKADV